TYDLLFSAPISVVAIVGGKFLAAVLVYTALLLLTVVLPMMLGQWAAFPWSALLSAYLGFWLLGLVFIGVGLFASALTEYQIVAAFTGVGILLVLWVLGLVAQDTEHTTLSTVLRKLSVSVHFDDFVQGLVNSTSIIFFLSFMLFWLTAAYRVVEANRWR
ncbi:MAG: ABC transporter permease, partial [Chloroflexota bacterium]